MGCQNLGTQRIVTVQRPVGLADFESTWDTGDGVVQDLNGWVVVTGNMKTVLAFDTDKLVLVINGSRGGG